MADISSFSSVEIRFSEDERKGLQNAINILNKISGELWDQDDEACEDLSYEYSIVIDNLESVLRGEQNFI